MPLVTMIAGPNGSGKSTLTRELERLGIPLGQYLNADDIAVGLTGDPVTVAATAQQVVRDRRAEALRLGQDHCFETVMSHPSHIDHLVAARAAGFETRLFFVATEDPLINVGRVANRVLHGGHDVPLQKISERYYRCLANLPAAIAASDSGLIYDNSSADALLRPIARIADGSLADIDSSSQRALRSLPAPAWWIGYLNGKGLTLNENGKIARV
jgi:predicted ABC-type ATPase